MMFVSAFSIFFLSCANLDDIAYRFIASRERPPTEYPPDTIYTEPPCERTFNRSILFTALISYELDTLNIVRAEYEGLADILLAENLQVHNPHNIKLKPFYLVDYIKQDKSITFVRCSHRRNRSDMWEIEDANNECLKKHTPKTYDIVIVGSIDEMLSRANIYRLKYCAIPSIPTSSAIGMPMGLIGRSFKSDWHYPQYPTTFSMPTVYKGDNIGTRSFAPINAHPIVGGVHLTNYCYLPAMVLKECWSTEYSGQCSARYMCEKTIESLKYDCYTAFMTRLVNEPGPGFVMPRLLRDTNMYPAWYGEIDEREILFYNLVCL